MISGITTCSNRAREILKRAGASLMHLKSYQIDGRLLRTGAANFSASGLKHQDNDLIIIENVEAAAAFKRRSFRGDFCCERAFATRSRPAARSVFEGAGLGGHPIWRSGFRQGACPGLLRRLPDSASVLNFHKRWKPSNLRELERRGCARSGHVCRVAAATYFPISFYIIPGRQVLLFRGTDGNS